MRISLLLQREPFVKILTDTVEQFWSRQYGTPFRTEWSWRKPIRSSRPSSDFFCNIYLNVLFPVGSRNGALAPIWREFSRSPNRWRTPLQMAYCRAALSPSWSGWFKQATMRVWPAHESLAETVIVPGNNKIRLLDHRNRCTHGLLKSGFSQDRFDNEISARQLAGGLGLPIPDLLQHDQVAGWFTESYVVGTPLNRLADQERAINVADRAFASLDLLIDETVQTTTVGDYVASLCDRIRSDLNQIDLLPDEMRRGVEGCVQRLTAALADSSDVALETAQTHGDFQPANILVADLKTQDARTDAQFWIIDWEYAGRRQRDYDWLVFHAHARRGSGLASRLRRIVGQAPSWRTASSGKQIALPQFASTIFLLEELELRLGENKNPRFTRVDGGLPTLLDEIQNWFDQA